MNLRRKALPIVASLAATGLLAVALTASAQTYPARPIHFIVPFTAGTGPDILARTLGEAMSRRLNQPIVVENKAGASGNIGTEQVAKAAPDGYTILVTVTTFAMAPALYRPLPFDPIDDFAPIGEVAVGSLALVVNPALKVATVPELVTLAKTKPGGLNYASPGNGTPQHLAMELFKQQMAVDIVHVPYKGSAGMRTDILSGQIQILFDSVPTMAPMIRAGVMIANIS